MSVALASRFQRDITRLEADRRAAVFEAMLSLPKAMGEPHLHAGFPIRKLHRSGIWEARVGLGLRLVLTLEPSTLTLVRIGAHSEVQRYLREL